jgi:hypothetical protein
MAPKADRSFYSLPQEILGTPLPRWLAGEVSFAAGDAALGAPWPAQ